VPATWATELGERGMLPHGPGGFAGCGWLLVNRVLWVRPCKKWNFKSEFDLIVFHYIEKELNQKKIARGL
jgi:hypothetical protein